MISSSYSIPEFIKAVENKGYQDIIYIAEREATEAERMSYRPRVASEAKKMGSEEYAKNLKHFLFYLRYHVKPFGVSDRFFALFESIAHNLEKRRRARAQRYGLA
jgi:hypothetical protein